MISDVEREELRSLMPEYLATVHGVTDLSRPFRCLNPEHEDRHPSMTFDKRTSRVKCWSCEYSADVFELAGVDNNVDRFPEKAARVAAAVGYVLDQACGSKDFKAVRPRRPKPPFAVPGDVGGADVSEAAHAAFNRMYEPGSVNDAAGEPYPIGAAAIAYLQSRGLGDDDIVRCGLGFTRNPKLVMSEFNAYEPDALGYVVIPYWNRDCTRTNYAMLRTVGKGTVCNKEWRPKGLRSPLYREWMLTSGLETVYVTEGLLDAISLEKQIDRNVMALGGVSMAPRLASILYHARKDARPGKIVIAMDEDNEGRKAAAKIANDLDVIGVPHSMMPPYPSGAKDANAWLMAREGVDWRFEDIPQFEGDRHPVTTTMWREGR